MWIEATGSDLQQFLAFTKNVRVKILHKIPSSISWKAEFENFWMNCKAWLNAKLFFLPLNFAWDKSLTISSGVLEYARPEIKLKIRGFRGVIVIKIKC